MLLDRRLEDDAPAARCDQRQVACEMNRIAETLFGVDEGGWSPPSSASPRHSFTSLKRREAAVFQPPLAEAAGEMHPVHQERKAVIPMRAFMRRVERDARP